MLFTPSQKDVVGQTLTVVIELVCAVCTVVYLYTSTNVCRVCPT